MFRKKEEVANLIEKNKEIIKKGEVLLKEIGMENFIISESNSVFVKKKKLRKMRDLVKLNSEGVNTTICEELMSYLDIFEENCRILMKKSANRNKT